jgi:hypothetical protein
LPDLDSDKFGQMEKFAGRPRYCGRARDFRHLSEFCPERPGKIQTLHRQGVKFGFGIFAFSSGG